MKISKELEKQIEAFGEALAAEYTKEDDFGEINFNGWYDDEQDQHIELEFTRMNDKWWEDIPYDELMSRISSY